jgi:hypothetical protein
MYGLLKLDIRHQLADAAFAACKLRKEQQADRVGQSLEEVGLALDERVHDTHSSP